MLVIDTTAQKTSPPIATFSGSNSSGKRSGLNTPQHPGSTPKNNERTGVDLSQILGTSDLSTLANEDEIMLDLQQNSTSNEQSSLSDFAQHVLKQICSQEWVLDRCLQNSESLCGMLIEDMLTSKQSQRLLHMICYPENEYSLIADMDQKSIIVRILENLEQWTLRISWLDLQLMYQQTHNNINNSTELANWLDTVARAAIDVFQIDEANQKDHKPKPSTWLVAPLVSKLPSAVQGRILRVAGQVLESTNFFTKSKENCDDKEKSITNGKRKIIMNNQPFLGLVLTCLKGQDEQKEGLLTSLHSQLQLFLQSLSEFENIGGIEDPLGREEMLEALQLRFSLVGGMFDAIQKNGNSTVDWAILLAQLICQGVVDLTTNCELFSTVVDMLATLIHSTLNSDSQSERDENKKLYNNLMKKLKKEIGDKNNSSIKIIRQLLPLFKQSTEVISCETSGIDGKGNKMCDMDKKQLRISGKQKITVWDILEGHKNPAPLSWAWFGAVKIERKPLAYEEAHRLLRYHTHSLVKPSSYYYEPLPLPPEEIEPIPEKIVKDEMKADTPSSVDQSPSAVVSGRGRGKGTRKPRKPKNSKTPPVNAQQSPQIQPQQQQQQQPHPAQQMVPNQMNQMHMNMQNQMNPSMQQFAPNQMMSSNPNQMMAQQQMQNPGNVQQQMNPVNQQNPQMGFAPGMNQGMNQQQQQQQQQWSGTGGYNQMSQQQQFYNQQGMQMNRFERPQLNATTPKQALSHMLRQRQPSSFMAGNQSTPATAFTVQQQQQQQQQQQRQQGMPQQQAIPQQQQQQQFMRSTLRAMAPNQMAPAQGNIPSMNPNMGQMGGQSNIGQGMNASAMMGQQNQMQPGVIPQTSQSQQGMAMGQNAAMMNANAGGSMMTQQNTGMVNSNMGQASGMMQQQNVGMVNQNSQFQNFPAYNNQGMNQQGGQQNMMGGFNPMNAQRSNPAEYMAQRALQANRGQYINQAPNITMNNMMGQGAAPPYNRQQPTGGKPGVVASQQFQQQQHRMRQQMMMQGMGQQPVSGPGMGQPQNQSMGQQQTPALVAQLQRQMPNQQQMMGQQYSHQPPPY